jgi:hypothetical protein
MRSSRQSSSVDPQFGAGCMSPFRRLNLEVIPIFLETLWTDGLQNIRSYSVDEISLAENPIQRCAFV